jgi:hypothetical protein
VESRNKKCYYTIESDRVQVNGVISEVQSIEVTNCVFAGVTRTWRRGGGEGGYRKCRMIYYPSTGDGILL